MHVTERLAALLTKNQLTVSTAESCTGGGLSAQLTAIPGASAFFLGGIIAYHNAVKEALLEVPHDALTAHGAVSASTAEAMAEGCRRRFRSDLAISITGIAGPGGGSPQKPVGLVFIAVATPQGVTAHEHRFPGDREAVRLAAVEAAIARLIEAAGCVTRSPS